MDRIRPNRTINERRNGGLWDREPGMFEKVVLW